MGEPTKGPWTMRRALRRVDGAYDYGIGAMVHGTERCIAETFGRCSETDWLPAEANAHLITSAPDLYDVALNVGGFDDSLLQSADLNLLRATLLEFRDQARAALAKARGEA